MSDAQDRLYEVATPILKRLVDAASQLGMTEEETREQLRNAGFGRAELDTFLTDGYLPYTPPTEQKADRLGACPARARSRFGHSRRQGSRDPGPMASPNTSGDSQAHANGTQCSLAGISCA